MKRATLLLAAVVLVVPGTVGAQTLYLSAEPVRPATGDEVRVRLMSGTPFAGKAVDSKTMRIQRLWHGGRTDLERAAGAATFRPTEPGIQLIASMPLEHEIESEVASYGKALLVIGDPPRTERIWRSELGQRLEIVPETDPVALARRGGSLEIQVLFDREPLAGAIVVAVAERAATESHRREVTDMLGRTRFELDRPGRWLLYLAHRSPRSSSALYQSSLLLAAGP
jgi:hypothetical protein